ncbi:MAG: immune inhibitor A [Ardenticatenaceae bacterium]|nr:immune inhibitor A [Ardenticatenaceae bacterium]
MKRWIILLMLLVGCRQGAVAPTVVPTAVSGAAVVEEAVVEGGETAVSPTTSTPLPGPQPTATGVVEAVVAETAVSPERDTFDQLWLTEPPERDDVGLAMAYRGLAERPAEAAPLVTAPLAEGIHQSFNIPNIDTNTVSVIDAQLRWVSNHAYFWFDTGPGSTPLSQSALREAGESFDAMYEQVVGYFGSEANPGLDGDPRVHVVSAAPGVLCDLEPTATSGCRLGGLVNATDLLPTAVDPRSNGREMFVMNSSLFGSSTFRSVLAHEFRHMIEDNHDAGDEDWAVEGSASLAQVLVGLPESTISRANEFLRNPDQQLNSWPDEGTGTYYGQGYLFNQYLFNRLGAAAYRDWATSPANGFLALDQVAAAQGLDQQALGLWRDWLVSLVAHNDPNVPPRFDYGELALETAVSTPILTLPYSTETTVHQFAADYYELPLSGGYTVEFTGEATVSLLGAEPFAGERMLLSQRANYSNPRLTRRLDLRGLSSATLSYAVYVDLEAGYDFGYVSVSRDNGRSWQGIVADHMQGLAEADDPAGAALTERFYTGQSRSWSQEVVDLTPFAGQEILLRFEVVTDPIKTFGGLALDNIAISELGFLDDVETVAEGWQAEGFVRVARRLVQPWQVQVALFTAEGVSVLPVLVEGGKTAVFTIPAATYTRPPVLIIAASAPQTLELASYQLLVR